MTKNELAKILNKMYFNSNDGEAVAMIHLFEIKYASEIRDAEVSFRELTKLSGIRPSYASEISKGAKLSSYVKVIRNV